MKKGFTLAEVLITLGIIGVVAAITIPTLIANYQKKVYYNQFMKAVNILENALKRYEYDNGCEGNIWNCVQEDDITEAPNFVENISKYFNIAQLINEDNAATVCKGYDKLPVSDYIDSSDRGNTLYPNLCVRDRNTQSNLLGFITTDGMLFNFALDDGFAGGSIVDINGPNKGPNTYGRDIFIFYMRKDYTGERAIKWGGQTQYIEPCGGNNAMQSCFACGCAAKLLQEGKMNY